MNPTFNTNYQVRRAAPNTTPTSDINRRVWGFPGPPSGLLKGFTELAESCYPHDCSFFTVKGHRLKSEMRQLSPGGFQCRASCCPVPGELRAAPGPPSKAVWQHTEYCQPGRSPAPWGLWAIAASLFLWMGWRPKFGQPCLCDQGPGETLTPAPRWVSLVVNPACVLSHSTTSRS